MAKEGNIAIDGKIRKNTRYPVGFMDVVTLLKTNTSFRLLYDCKGRFGLNKITKQEAETKLCKVKCRAMGPKDVPYIVTHDGRTIRYPNPEIKKNDSIKLDLTNGQITGVYKFELGTQIMVTGGNNIGRVGVVSKIDKHDGSYTIVHVKDERGATFSTRQSNVFVIGTKKPEISLLKRRMQYSIIEERTNRAGRKFATDA
jgi:small subunit ribosomal protein S4e